MTMSMTEKILIWAMAGAFMAVCIVAAFEALRDFDEDGFYE
jgi:hypothetical protein